MLCLKKINYEDIEKEWIFVHDMPENENGLINDWHNVSREDFEQKVLPSMITGESGKGFPEWKVPESFFFLWDDDTIVGQFRIRHFLTQTLKNGAGHIGYFIGREYRGRGYATKGLKLTLELARDMVPEDEFFLRLYKYNTASLRVMEKNGGKVVKEDDEYFYVRIPNPNGRSRNLKKLTEYLDTLLSRGIPSFDCIVYQNHEQIYRHMAGKVNCGRDKDVSEDTLYLMFSMTKVMTMCCIMQLVEQGKVSLEDPVSKFLPAYGKLSCSVNGQEEALEEPLLIKHLLSMQSGLDYNLDRPGIRRVLVEKGDAATTRELVDAFVESPISFVPGTHFCYSLSHDVVAAVVEVASGMKFGEYMKKNIWEPLGLKNTFFAKPMNDDIERLAQQYICNEKGEIVIKEQSCNYQLSSCYESGGAGLISNTEDYAILADAIACGGVAKNGVRILNPETVVTMKTNMLGEASRQDLARLMGRVGYGYGCGMQVLMEPEMINSSAPVGVFGWDGAAGSCITMETKQQLSVVYIQHVRNCGFAYGEIHPTIRDLVFG